MHKGVKASIEALGVQPDPALGHLTYLMETEMGRISEADVVLLIGVDPRKEAPLLNVKLREGFLRGTMKVYSIGNQRDLTYPVQNRGNTIEALVTVARGYHPVSRARAGAKKPRILMGASVRMRKDHKAIRGRMDIMHKAMLKHNNVAQG